MEKSFLIATLFFTAAIFLTDCHREHVWVEATCIEAKYCAECDEVDGEQLGHDWREATCTAPMTCGRCGDTDGIALGHDWLEATCITPKTCENCSKIEGVALGHDWSEASCTNPKACESCNETEGDVLGHDWSDATCTSPKICINCEETEGVAIEHDWLEATCLEAETCSMCGETEGEPLPHNLKAATQQAPATCVDCGATEGEPLPPKPPTEASAATPNTRVTSGFDYELALEAYRLANEEIVNNNRLPSPHTWCEELAVEARIRTQELSVLYAHVKPDGSEILYAENIGVGYKTAKGVVDAWIASPGHAETLFTNPSRTAVACYKINGRIYWIQIFEGGFWW